MLMMLISAETAIATHAKRTMSPWVGAFQISLANRRESHRGRRHSRDERQHGRVAGEPAIVRIDQAAVPLIGKASYRYPRGKVRVHEHDEEHTRRTRDPQPDPNRTGSPEQAGNKKKIAVEMLIMEKAMAKDPYGPRMRLSDWT